MRRRRTAVLLLGATFLWLRPLEAQTQDCTRESADYVGTIIREARLCLTIFVPRGLSCSSRNRIMDFRASRVNSRCSPGTVERLRCAARPAIQATGLTYESLTGANFTHVCTTTSCGNGLLESGEQCDDGNVVNTDGCSATCQLESTSCGDACAGIVPVSGTAIKAERVASGLSSPVYVTAPPGDVSRIFIVQQTGAIRILEWGTLLPTPFINLSAKISCCAERGLLSMAFHPQYATNGRFYVDYTDTAGRTVVASYQVSADPDIADPASESILLQVSQPFSNHNGGQLAFGPGGYLFISMGDGGSGGDPFGNGQSLDTLLGKVLRIDVDGAAPYAIPPTNPFAGPGDPGLDEIWAYGLRNPWRLSFDELTGDLYVGDVGQNSFEEIDYQPVTSPGGENYGWNIVEGNGHCFSPPTGCDQTGLTLPVLEYSHAEGCSVTGGFVYRGCQMPDLHGRYFFADFCTAFIRSFRIVGGTATDMMDHTSELAAGGGFSIGSISSFGQDARGELYITDLGGEVFKIVPGP
jgi:cysteine-rich repeat protein